MFCSSCGNQNTEGSGFCEYCGAKIEGGEVETFDDSVGSMFAPLDNSRALGIRSIIFGLTGIFLFIMSFVGIVFGVQSIIQKQKSGNKDTPFGVIGIIISIITIPLNFLFYQLILM
jgi:uncharacterized membrane protein YvbJ